MPFWLLFKKIGLFSNRLWPVPWSTKGGSITVPLTSCSTGLDWSVLQIKTIIVSCHTADSKPVKQEVNGAVILPALVFPACTIKNMMTVMSDACTLNAL